MVKIGSGGAIFGKRFRDECGNRLEYNDAEFIAWRLPLAQARSYIQIFWALQRDPVTGRGIRCSKMGSSGGGLRATIP